jgi:selenocysteine-specific elongation factor
LIVRSYSPVTTIAGGVVLEWSERPYRRRPPQLPLLEQLRSTDPTERSLVALQLAGWAGLLSDTISLHVPDFPKSHAPGMEAGGRRFDPGRVEEAKREILNALERLHEDQPYRDAIEIEQIRSALPRRIASSLREGVLRVLTDSGKIAALPGGVALAGWKGRLNPRHEQIRAALIDKLGTTGLTPPDSDQLTAELGPEVPELLRQLARDGLVVAVSREFFMSRAAVHQAEQTMRTALQSGPRTVPELKAALGLSRKHLIPLLEHFDRAGLTRRNDDSRILTRVETVSDMRDATV